MATKKDDGIRLAEADHVEAFDDDYAVRTCDLGRFLTGDAGTLTTSA